MVVGALRRVRDGADPGGLAADLVRPFLAPRNTAGAWTESWIDQRACVSDLGLPHGRLADVSAALLIAPRPDDEVLGGSAVMRDGL